MQHADKQKFCSDRGARELGERREERGSLGSLGSLGKIKNLGNLMRVITLPQSLNSLFFSKRLNRSKLLLLSYRP